MNSTQIVSSIKSKDINAVLGLSELALREKQEPFIPVLFHCLTFCNDPLLKRNLIRLMSLFHKKYLLQIKKFAEDENLEVRNLTLDSIDLIESIQSSPVKAEEDSVIESEETYANRLYSLLEQESLQDLCDLISAYKKDLVNWNEVQCQEMIDFIVPRCFGLKSNLSDQFRPPLLELLVQLRPQNMKQDYLSLLKNNSFNMFCWGVIGLGKDYPELLSEHWYKFIGSYQGSVAQRQILKMYLKASRGIPNFHKQWLDEVVEKFEDDKVLIKEISEAYQWEEPDTVPRLLTWFNKVQNEDLKFRIVRSLDALIKVEHIQFIQNTIEITVKERDKGILTNLLLPLEAKIQKSGTKGDLSSKKNIDINNELPNTRQHYLPLYLTVPCILVCLVVLVTNKPDLLNGYHKLMEPAQVSASPLIMPEQCVAQLIRLNPLRLLCDGYLISIRNATSDWQSYWLGEKVKVRLSGVEFTGNRSLDISAHVSLIDAFETNNDLPRIGVNTN